MGQPADIMDAGECCEKAAAEYLSADCRIRLFPPEGTGNVLWMDSGMRSLRKKENINHAVSDRMSGYADGAAGSECRGRRRRK